MAASQVVLYFDKPEDALLFTLAASSMISDDTPGRANDALGESRRRDPQGQPDYDRRRSGTVELDFRSQLSAVRVQGVSIRLTLLATSSPSPFCFTKIYQVNSLGVESQHLF